MVELRTGVTAGEAANVLRQVANNALNARVMSHPQGDRTITMYLSWADNATRGLGNALTFETIDDLIHTQNYWVLRVTRTDAPVLNAQVIEELESRSRVLNTEADELDRERRRWKDHPASLVVPDTNLFLQDAQPFEQIDWRIVSSGDVRIVVPLVIIHELDRLKRHKPTRALARSALKWLATKLPADLDARSEPIGSTEPTVRVEVYVQDVPSHPEDPDRVIFQFAKRLAQLSEMPTTLVTYDLGMRLRAAAIGVNVTSLPDE